LPDIVRIAAAQDDSNQVVGAGGVIALLHRRSDFVIGLSDDLGGGNSLQVIAESAKRKDVCHIMEVTGNF
jgi:hypothetical protein